MILLMRSNSVIFVILRMIHVFFIEVDNRQEAAECINSDLNKIKNWSNQWLVTFSPP